MPIPSVVILTGAGISAESGLSTFRSQNGLWEGYAVDKVATYEGYQRDPRLVHQFYNNLRKKLQSPEIKPNAAHIALAKLEKAFGAESVLLVTQNVDNLHERAGSEHILHMHGELLKVRDEKTGQILDWQSDVDHTKDPTLRPHIVWFGEMPLNLPQIYDALTKASYFISIGTSGNIYPAAGFIDIARKSGSKTIELNLEPSLGENQFNQRIYGKATEVVPAFVAKLLKDWK